MKNLASLLLVLLFPLGLMAADETTELTVQTDDVIDVEAGEGNTTSTTTITPVNADSGNIEKGVEKIQVTGSHIKRIDVEGPSPVVTLDRKFLDDSGYNSVADVLRDTTMASFGAAREASGSSAAGSATIGLRGFGSDKILVLLNGQRLPKIGGANSVDLNLIPFQALDRVEILKDGASATYGSDALAGVINFVTKKDYDGSSVQTRVAVPEEVGGGRQDVAATYGKNFAKGNILAVYQYRNNKRIWDRDREWTRGMGQSSFGSPGSYNDGTGWKAAEDCPETIPLGGGQEFCKFDFTPFSSGLPDLEQHNAMMTGEYEVSSSMKTFALATYTRRKADWQYAPAPDLFTDNTATGGKNYKIPASAAQKIGLNAPAAGDIDLRYRLVDELGPRANRDTTDAYGAVMGMKGYAGDTWDWEVSTNYGLSQLYNQGHAGYGHSGRIFDAIANKGTLKPLAPKSTKAINPDIMHVSEQWVQSDIASVQAIANGELGQALGANLSMAVGTSAAWESYNVRVDDVTAGGDLFGGAGENGDGSRNFQSLFTELAANYETVEMQLAGRVDNYSDFGSTFNPKFGIRYKPFQSVMLRGSVGTGFKAPSLSELYSTSSYGFPAFFDAIGCEANGDAFSCRNQQYRTFSGGNPNLQEETSFSYNIGTVIQPNRNFSITVDYWVTEIENAVDVDFNNIMLAEQRLGQAALNAQGVYTKRDANGRLTELIAPNLNLAAIRSEGLDVGMGYTMRLGALTLRPQTDYSLMLRNEEQAFPGMGFLNNLDEYGAPRWRNVSSITARLFGHGLRLTARTIASQYRSAHLFDKTDQRRIGTFTGYDVNYDYQASWGGTFQLGARNVFAHNRPTDDENSFGSILNTGLYDPTGRLYYMGYSQTF